MPDFLHPSWRKVTSRAKLKILQLELCLKPARLDSSLLLTCSPRGFTIFFKIQMRFYKDSCPIVSDLIFKQSLRSINARWVYLCNITCALLGLNNVSLPEIKEERKIKYQFFTVLRINYLIINYVFLCYMN